MHGYGTTVGVFDDSNSGNEHGDRGDRGLTEEMERSAARKTAVAPWISISSRFSRVSSFECWGTQLNQRLAKFTRPAGQPP